MLEPWDELLALQKQHRICKQDVENLKASCLREHGKTHVIECSECWTRLVYRMRDRYLNSPTKEWFFGRRNFLQELDSIFSRAHDHEIGFDVVEQRILDEKNEWYQDRVRGLGLLAAAESPEQARSFQQKLNDPSITTHQLHSELRSIMDSSLLHSEEAFATFISRLQASESAQGRIDASVDIFFQPGHDMARDPKARKYIEMFQSGMPLADAINVMLRDRQASEGSQEEKQRLQRKLEELRRAKAAHELDKAKRDKTRQDKGRAALHNDAQHNLSPCSVCSESPDAKKFHICQLCQILGGLYDVIAEPILFCSDECRDEGYELHLGTHECASGQSCTRLNDGDVDMEFGEMATLIFCRHCVQDLYKPSVFCSPYCFDTNFQQHSDKVHITEQHKAQQETTDDDQLEYDAEGKSRHRARKIEDHLVTLDEAMTEWQQKTGASLT
ncbi:hypothetical protein F4778DRAFT_400543 [Xylariomycetidae sp. FL2044]|nr:hypothetical protein F4778DRAFT_400543 [Xylariomycetidae sp. FL2044]